MNDDNYIFDEIVNEIIENTRREGEVSPRG